MSLVCAGGFAAFGVAALVLRFVRRTRKRTITWDDAIKRAREHALQDGEEYGICPLTGKKRTSFYVNPLDVWEPSELERALTRVEVVKPVVEVEGIGMDADVGMDGPEMIETTFASVGRDIQPGTCSKDLIVTEETEMRIDTPEDWDSDSKPLILAQVTEITPPIAKTESSSIDCDGAAAQFSEPLPIWVQSQPQSSTFICPHPSCFKEFSKQFELNHHARYHYKDKPCPLPTCPEIFSTTKDLNRHINSVHQTTKKYYCTVMGCKYSKMGGTGMGTGQWFSRKDNWRRHMRDRHGRDGGDGGMGDRC